jgi:uncharacterized protein YjbI with pentapeptide repeats
VENNSELIEISQTKKTLQVKCAMIDGSYFNDISAKNVKIINANLSDPEIEDAQLGGAYFHNIGIPPKGHQLYDPTVKQRPVRFEDCDLTGSTITNCNLGDISIEDCNLAGMKINGILVEDLLRAYKK